MYVERWAIDIYHHLSHLVVAFQAQGNIPVGFFHHIFVYTDDCGMFVTFDRLEISGAKFMGLSCWSQMIESHYDYDSSGISLSCMNECVHTLYIRSTPRPVRVEKYIATCQGLKKSTRKSLIFGSQKWTPNSGFGGFTFSLHEPSQPHKSEPANTKNMIPPLTFPHPSPFPSASHTTIQKHGTVIRFKLEVVKL